MIATLSGCNAIFGVDELRFEPAAQVSSSSVGGGSAASTASSGGAPQGGNGGAGGCTNCLVDRGLVARYFIDEADSGQAPAALLDAAPGGLPLTIDYGGPAVLAFSGAPGKRGLQWTMQGTAAKASAPIAGTKLVSMLDGSAQATMEMVVEIESVVFGGSGVAVIGAGNNFGGLSFAVRPSNEVVLFWHGGTPVGNWTSTVVGAGRLVLHAVLEATHPDPLMRARYYVNGMETASAVPTVADGEVIDLSGETTFVVGSGVSVARSPKGIIAYVAYYNVAMAQAEILVNVARLNVSDDTQ